MKMTMHIDEVLLDKVMKANGLESKTETIAFALNELDRRERARIMATKGIGLSKAELASCIVPEYDVVSMRLNEDAVEYKAPNNKKRPHVKARSR